MCDIYYDDVEGRRTIRMDVKDKEVLQGIKVGSEASFKVQGEVTEVTAPRMVRDYSVDWDRKKGSKPPMKEEPGKVVLLLDKNDPEIEQLNAMLMADDLGAD